VDQVLRSICNRDPDDFILFVFDFGETVPLTHYMTQRLVLDDVES